MAANARNREHATTSPPAPQPGIMSDFARLLAAEIVNLIKPELARWFDTLDQLALRSQGLGRTKPEQSSERTGMKTSPLSTSSTPEGIGFMRLPEVLAMTGLPKTSLYTLIRAGDFPNQVQLGPRAVGWVRSEVRQWTEERVLSRASDLHPLDLK